MTLQKIFSDDPLLKYKDTEIDALRTKAQVDGMLAEYGTKDVWWHWEKEAVEKNEPASIFVRFVIEEVIEGVPINVAVKVDCPVIWDRGNKLARKPENRIEKVNWDISMRALHWFIYTHLNSAYAMRSSKTVAFLPFIQGAHGKSLKDLILPRLSEYQALEDKTPQDRKPASVIDAEVVPDEN